MGKPIVYASVHACFSFCNEANTGFAFIRVRDEASIDCCPAHSTLLGAFPSIRVAEHDVNIVFDMPP